mmetsp:Transcript_13827/g.31355  ORF Transcript_13827/g.31355 Transcript_13827/m.31355 type:complete len:632 (-) Transcript_13827:226-2121(-)
MPQPMCQLHDRLQYYSKTHQGYVDCVVEYVDEKTGDVELDCKRGYRMSPEEQRQKLRCLPGMHRNGSNRPMPPFNDLKESLEPSWSLEQMFLLDSSTREDDLRGCNLPLLDPHIVDSLKKAVGLLNAGEANGDDGFCVVWSASSSLYGVLYRQGSKEEVFAKINPLVRIVERKGAPPIAHCGGEPSHAQRLPVQHQEYSDARDEAHPENESRTVPPFTAAREAVSCSAVTPISGKPPPNSHAVGREPSPARKDGFQIQPVAQPASCLPIPHREYATEEAVAGVTACPHALSDPKTLHEAGATAYPPFASTPRVASSSAVTPNSGRPPQPPHLPGVGREPSPARARAVHSHAPSSAAATPSASPHGLSPMRRFPSQSPMSSPAASASHSAGLETSTKPVEVMVIAPGAGTRQNASVYEHLGAKSGPFLLKILGNTAAAYDRYPESWEGGAPPPNLESFGEDLARSQLLCEAQCLMFGSRGGQVVLPTLWKKLGAQIPPAVVVNGGCAMRNPSIQGGMWPQEAVTMILIGGKDYFRNHIKDHQGYIKDTMSRVPSANGTTAVVFVSEMQHMPQKRLLMGVLGRLIKAAVQWRALRQVPLQHFNEILCRTSSNGFSGSVYYTESPGNWRRLEHE